MESVLAHNERAATTWGSGGRDYDHISEGVADALAHVVSRILPQPGERFLDVATGTGWTARLLASRGAAVTGVDIGSGVIEAAKALAPDIDFRVGDAEALPFDENSFDAVTSTFGVMFVARPEVAARELARVCKSGARLGLVTWVPGGTVAGIFQTMRPYMPPLPPNPPLLRSNGGARRGFANCSAMPLTYASKPVRRRCGCPMADRCGSFSSKATVRQRRSPPAAMLSDEKA